MSSRHFQPRFQSLNGFVPGSGRYDDTGPGGSLLDHGSDHCGCSGAPRCIHAGDGKDHSGLFRAVERIYVRIPGETPITEVQVSESGQPYEFNPGTEYGPPGTF